MLNEKKERELAYVVAIDEILPIEGADRVEIAKVGGWRVMVRKNQFKPGDLAVYFEIDSQVPEREPFLFLAQKHFKIKTQKYFKGTVISQGLLMSFEDFGWTPETHKKGDFVTQELEITYAVTEDNIRKANSTDKYKQMAQRMGKLFSKQPFHWLMQREWGKKVLFVFFGKKKDTRSGWPTWVVKTDEERVQNMPWILKNKDPWIATEKIDGTSTTFTMKRSKIPFHKNEFYICSRNVVFQNVEQPCFYDSNVYMEMAKKYRIEEALTEMLKNHTDWDWITLQGETYGAGIQKRDYHVTGHQFMGFNLIDSKNGRWNSVNAAEKMKQYGIPWVPIVNDNFILPDTIEELLNIATDSSVVDGDMREGLVFRSLDGSQSFKAVSNEFLLKYHQ